MTIKTINFIFLYLLLLPFSLGQAASLIDDKSSAWSEVSEGLASSEKEHLEFLPEEYGLFSLDEGEMRSTLFAAARSTLFTAARSSSGTTDNAEISLPLPDGQLIKLNLTESSLMEPELAAKYPGIKTFKVQGVDRPEVTGTIGINTLGFHGMLFTENGERIFIDRRKKDGRVYYISYHAKEYRPSEKKAFSCEMKNNQSISSLSTARSNQTQQRTGASQQRTGQRTGATRRTYRIAIAATGEYTAVFGGTKAGALAAMTTTLARVNEMFERDLSVSMTLVANNDDVIYTDASTDPFTNNNAGILKDESQTEIDKTIGSANYDIGHTFSTGAGGLADFGSVCADSKKASGVTGRLDPQNDSYDIDFVAHEIGHQFDGRHLYNGVEIGCVGNQRNAGTAFEPGSGSTIMSYAGLCGSDNLQSNSDAMFHSKSIEAIGSFIDNSSTGGSCGTSSDNGNNQPTANAGSDYTIPISTPFELTGSGSDADSFDILTYSWEQIDAGAASNVNVDTGDNAIFRTFLPTSTATRTFPKANDVLTGTTSIGEVLPSTSRSLNFRLAVRDQDGGVGVDDTTITVDNAGGAFAVTSHSTSTTLTAGSSTNVLWNAGNTASGPINCTSVDISLALAIYEGGNTSAAIASYGGNAISAALESALLTMATKSSRYLHRLLQIQIHV